MATKEEIENVCPPSPDNFSGGNSIDRRLYQFSRFLGDENSFDTQESEHEDPEEPLPPLESKSSVADLLKQLQSSGALVKKKIEPPEEAPEEPSEELSEEPSEEPSEELPERKLQCVTCNLTYPDWDTLEDHLIQHVSLPKIVVDRLPSDDESEPDHEPGDEDWSDEEVPEVKPKVDVSELLKNKYLSIKKTDTSSAKAPDSALSKLAGLGLLKKTPVKEEPTQNESKDDLMNKLGKLGGLKLKLQTTTQGNKDSFKVINGLKDFSADDEEDDWSGKEDEDGDKSEESQETADDTKNPEGSDPSPVKTPTQTTPLTTPTKASPNVKVVKVLRIIPKGTPIKANIEAATATKTTAVAALNMSEVIIKNEPVGENDSASEQGFPGFPVTGQVKSECPSPPLNESSSAITGTTVKTETEDDYPSSNTIGLSTTGSRVQITEVIDIPIQPKKEKDADPVAIIEINGDSNDEDDDCCVVSATPAADIKPKIEPSYPPTIGSYQGQPATFSGQPTSVYSNQTLSSSGPGVLSSRLVTPASTYSTEKQHNFNWNAPDQKPQVEILEKSADAIFESLLASSNQKKEITDISDASEYISLDKLGPQHTCEVCNTRFTDISILENHRRQTGHSKSLVAPSHHQSGALIPAYSSSNSLISSLFPVKQLAEQVGRLSAVGTNSGAPFTHQQNVMINIQAYPGQLGAGMMAAPQQYAAYPGQQGAMPGNYQPAQGNMYRMPGQPMPGQTFASPYPPGQYAPQSYAGVSSPGYMSGTPSYSTASPLQGMQQAVYGQGVMGNSQPMAPLGPPGQMQSGQLGSPQFATPPSPNSMKPPPAPGNIRIQNVQSFSPGQSPGVPGQPVRGGAPMRGGVRPRMPGVRPGMRPTIRPGIQVQGQGARGGKGPRMPMKRPAGAPPGAGPGKKRMDMLLPGKHDNEDCTVMAMQKQRDGLPMINSVHGSKDNFNLGSGLSITKKTVNKEASGMASLLASRGIMVKQKAKSRSPSPDRPVPHIPNLGSEVSIKHTSRSSGFSIPEAKVGGGMNQCRMCKKMFMNQNSLNVHMSTAHPGSKVPMFKCEECPASYPKAAQLQHHRRVFHNVSGPDRELGLPVVDLSQEENLKRLSDLGIYSFIPLANREQASGCFGIPVISVHNMNNGIVRGLTALGADGLLSLGPLKPLPNT